jgi:hypothetical protein
MNLELKNFLLAAIECSVFLDPSDPGLTYDEILEVGQKTEYQAGEIGDAIHHALTAGEITQGSKFLLDDRLTGSWQFLFKEEPDFRNFDAFDFVVAELNARGRALGADRAFLERSLVVERANQKGISGHDIQLAITYQLMAGMLTEKDGILRFPHNQGTRSLLPSEQLRSSPHPVMKRPLRARAHPIVKDVIERRTDRRPKHVEAFDAFAEELNRLGYGPFRLWWKQLVAELRYGDAHFAPVSVLVLAAALVEGALTFVVAHARTNHLGVFQSKDFDGEPRTWKIDRLVASACSGSDFAILDPQIRGRTEMLLESRQRIHAGRMLEQFPAGPPDIRPEEARDAKTTADLVVRRVLDWLQRYPPS